jgi:hypothetical protein
LIRVLGLPAGLFLPAGLLVGCVHGPSPQIPRTSRDWSVAVSVATGDRVLESFYDLHTEPIAPNRWMVSTARTRGTWIEHGASQGFDSEAPTARDPWPLVLQHLVASVPAEVRIEEGRVDELVAPDEWAAAARRAIYGSKLPVEALDAGEALLDPDGLVADLARTFPGTPPSEGVWERPDRIAGLEVVRREQCEPTGSGWSCDGSAEGADGQDARLFETTTFTRLAADHEGLLWVESGYSGTLVSAAIDGRGVMDRPISGLRRVQRR